MSQRYEVRNFFDKWAKLLEAEQNEHDEENSAMGAETEQGDPNMVAGNNPHIGNQEQEEQSQNQSAAQINKITTPFSIFAGKQIENMSLKKVGPNSAELKMELKAYGPVTVSWVNNTITLTDSKTGRVINL